MDIGQWVVRNFTVHCLLCLIFLWLLLSFFYSFLFFFLILFSFLLKYPYPNLWILFNFLPHHTVGVGCEEMSVWRSTVCWAKPVECILLAICQIKTWDSLGFQEPRKWVRLKQTFNSWLKSERPNYLKIPISGIFQKFWGFVV